MADEMTSLDKRLTRYRGQEHIGIPQKTLPKLDEHTLGLRGLVLLAGPPNIGRTSLGTQIGIDSVLNNDDVCFLFVSLEMSRWDVYIRLLSRLAKIDWHDLTLGNKGKNKVHELSAADKRSIKDAYQVMEQKGKRIKVLDSHNFPNPTVDGIVRELEVLKEQSKATRAVILVDYLQVWLPAQSDRAGSSDLAFDQWQVGQMRTLRDLAGERTAVIVVSEARKPKQEGGHPGSWSVWELADIMGVARASYTPDMVLLLYKEMDYGETDSPAAIPCKLRIVKGRDGMTKGTIDLMFHTRQNYFKESSK